MTPAAPLAVPAPAASTADRALLQAQAVRAEDAAFGIVVGEAS